MLDTDYKYEYIDVIAIIRRQTHQITLGALAWLAY